MFAGQIFEEEITLYNKDEGKRQGGQEANVVVQARCK